MEIDVTEDHSIFNLNQEKIKPSEVNDNTQLEYFKDLSKLSPSEVVKCDGRTTH